MLRANFKPAAKEAPAPEEKVVETDHEITVNGNRISYRALAGDIQIKDEKQAAKASIFYIAYLAQNRMHQRGR